MKIENYEGTADTFTFPHNSRVFDVDVQKFVDQRDYNYAFSYFGVTKGIKNRTAISINGHFDDAGTGSKVTNIQALLKHCNDNNLKKLYLSTSYFYIVIPQGGKVTHSGGRTMFRDYVASFISPFGILFSNTQRSGAYNSAEDNDGNVYTPIEKIVTTSASAASTYTYKDKSGNGFSITASASGTLTIYLIKMQSLGADSNITEYQYAEIGSTKQVLSLATAGQTMLLGLDAGESLNTAFNTGSAAVPANTTFYYRDGYSAE